MRLVLASALVFFGGSTAFASSIVTIGGEHAAGSSIVGINCETCKTAAPVSRKPTYTVPELASPPQKTDIVDINGEKKLVRTEAWFGGSPVIHVSKLPGWMSEQKAVASLHPTGNGSTERDIAATTANGDGIDLGATTSAVDATDKISAAVAPAVEPRPLLIGDFQLRIN